LVALPGIERLLDMPVADILARAPVHAPQLRAIMRTVAARRPHFFR
jgi:hypothetical protein